MATVTFYLQELKDGKEGSIMVRFSINRGNRFKLATGEKIPVQQWDSKKQEARAKWPHSLLFNQSLTKIKADLIQLYRDNKTLPASELQQMARPLVRFGTTAVPQKKRLLPALEKFIEQYQKDKDSKTVAKYATLKTKLEAFMPDLAIDGTDNNFYDAFKDELYGQGLMDSSVYKAITNLSTFLTWADNRGHEIHYTKGKPTHKAWEILKHRYEPITLTLAELEKLETLQINEDLINEKLPAKKHGHRGEKTLKALIIARDAFILECRTCQRISDLKKFDLKDVIDGVWHNTVTKGNRMHLTKTKVPLNTTFTAPAWEILRKYKFQFPEISEQKINENIKTVCMLAGIDQEITQYRWKRKERIEIKGKKYEFISTHVARKTFITLALQYMEGKLVKDLAGISWNTLKHYEGESEDQNLIKGLNSIPTSKMSVA